MAENRYAIYARRIDETNWTDWCQVCDLTRAFEHAETVRGLGFKARINDRFEKKVILKDD